MLLKKLLQEHSVPKKKEPWTTPIIAKEPCLQWVRAFPLPGPRESGGHSFVEVLLQLPQTAFQDVAANAVPFVIDGIHYLLTVTKGPSGAFHLSIEPVDTILLAGEFSVCNIPLSHSRNMWMRWSWWKPRKSAFTKELKKDFLEGTTLFENLEIVPPGRNRIGYVLVIQLIRQQHPPSNQECGFPRLPSLQDSHPAAAA